MKSVSNYANRTTPEISQSNVEKIREEVRDANTDNINRNTILLAIVQNPGIRYRELLRLIDFSNSVLAYHLKRLKKCRRIIVVRQNKKNNKILLSCYPSWRCVNYKTH